MNKETLKIDDALVLEITDIAGDLRVRGWEHDEIQAKTSGEILEILSKDEKISLKCDSDLILSLPSKIKLIIGNISDDASFRNIGQVEIGQIGGDLSLRQAISLTVKSIGDDASIRNVSGEVNIGEIADDLHLRSVQGSVNVKVGNDAILYIDPQKDSEHEISAGNDILLRLPNNADVRLDLNAGDELHVDYPDIENSNSDEEQQRKLDLGLATAKMTLTAGGDLHVTTATKPWADMADFDIPGIPDISFPFEDFDFPQFADDVAEKISRKMDSIPDNIAEHFSHKMDSFPDDFTERISRKLDSKLRRADKEMRQAEKKMRQAEIKMKKHHFSPENWGAKGKKKAVSSDERMLILKMLEENKISTDDAEKLLLALES
ncbi:MAG: hypothetical protein HN392_10945 [Anaerolineae bacterium]|jgi:hypothetical protein|nr:hypothetical protein [Anaerolineae bacterium]MBT7073651.1 hypothetical protein [Anaerolineae bacterium]MBT7782956.1 hypothetical protein [Anaerolineae bacterium]